MAQRANGFAKRAAAPDRAGRNPQAAAGAPTPLKIAPLLAPYRKHGRLALRIERMPQQARLSAGRNNGNGTWSLSLDELEDLHYLPPDGASELPELAIRIIALEENGETLALLEHTAPEPARAVAPQNAAAPASSDALAKLSRLHGELAQARSTLEAREAELAAAHENWKAELDRRLSAAAVDAAAALEKARVSWNIETESRVTRAEGHAQDRRIEARDLWKREAHTALIEAQDAWKAEEAKRLAAAQAQWQAQTAKAVADAGTKASVPPKESDDVKRLRAEHASARSALAERDAALAQLRNAMEQAQVRWKQDFDTTLAKSREAWKAEEAARLADAEARWRDRSEKDLTEARTHADQAQSRNGDELQRLRDGQQTLHGTIAQRDKDLADLRSTAETARGQDSAELQRLRDGYAAIQATLAQKDTELTQARTAAERANGQDAGELQRLRDAYAATQAMLAKKDTDLTEARAAAERAGGQDAGELQRLRDAYAALQTTLAQKDSDLIAARASAEQAGSQDGEELQRLQDAYASVQAMLAQKDADLAEARAAVGIAGGKASPDSALEDLREECTALKAALVQRDTSLAAMEQAKEFAQNQAGATLAELTSRCERAETALERAQTQAAAPSGEPVSDPALQEECAALRGKLSERDAALEAGRSAQEEARKRWQLDLDTALAKAKTGWEGELGARMAAAGQQWEEQSTGALAEATARYKAAEAGLASVRMRAEAARDRGEEADVAKLRGDLTALQSTLTDREAQLVYARSALESRGIPLPEAGHMRHASGKERDISDAERQRRAQARSRLFRDAIGVACVVVFLVMAVVLFPRIEMLLPQTWQDNIAIATEDMHMYFGEAQEKAGEVAAHATAAVGEGAGATLTHSANIRSGPSPTAGVVSTLRRGAAITTGVRKGNWIEVRTAGAAKAQGWVYAPYVKPAAAAAGNK